MKSTTKRKHDHRKKDGVTNEQRRKFLKKMGMGAILASAYTLISITPFGCVHDPVDDMVPRGGY